MEFIRIPNVKQEVCRIGLGTWAIGGWMWGGTDEPNAIRTIHAALDRGINLIDTAPVYGFGTSEEIVGKALREYGQRDRIVVATKVGLEWKNEKPYRNSSKQRIIKEVEDSLRRLQIDYIDIYQIHWPDPSRPMSETAEVMKELLDAGKIRAIGVSNFSLEQIREFRKTAPLHVGQYPFNIFESEIQEAILPFCLENQISTLGYGSLCRALLTGKMKSDTQFEGDDIRKVDPKFQIPRYLDYLKCVDALGAWLKKKYNRPLTALAVRWCLDNAISVALWGARQPQNLDLIDSVWGWKLQAEDFTEIDRIVSATIVHPVGPEFMAPP